MSRKNLFLVLIITLAAAVNFVGTLSPELGFDALWYHLTIAKIYSDSGSIFNIPGGLLYYSAMPRLTEILYIPLLRTLSDTGPHVLSFLAGIGSAILTYFIARTWLDKTKSLLAVVIFYITPLVGWLSGSAYVDLIRTFWETLAIFLIFRKRFNLAGLVLGIALSTKSLALGSVPIDLILLFFVCRNFSTTVRTGAIAFFVALPWYLLALLNTGNPFFPIAGGILDARHSAWPQISQPVSILTDFWKVFLTPEDLISPIFVIVIPFAILKLRELKSKYWVLIVYFFLSYAVWWIIPRLGGGRFLLPFLPMWSILSVIVMSLQRDWIQKMLIGTVILVAGFNLVYRAGAEFRLKNYLLGRVSRAEFLCRNLDFDLGVFVDCDGFFAKNIKPTDLVLVKGVHNLFYIDFPFVHESFWRGEKVNYVLIQGNQSFQEAGGRLVYQNQKTKVKLYKLD